MNKKLLFGIMSLAALTACTSDDFESQKVAQQEASPIQFEVLNNDALTRAEMAGNKIVWSAADGDLFTLYHGATAAPWTTGYENATYKANASEGASATLTTPSMIKQGKAIMMWPVDTTFRIKAADNLTLKIKPYFDGEALDNIENNIPYVSDLLDIDAYAPYSETGAYPTAYKTAGYARKYPVYMRPMASQLIVKADYVGTDATLKTLYEGGSEGLTGDDAIAPITLTSVDLLTRNGGTTLFTAEIPLQFTAPTAAIQTQWKAVPNNLKAANVTVWNKVTDFDIANIAAAGQKNKLSTSVIDGTESCKFLILPQANMATVGAGVLDGGIVVNTYYGRVVIAANGMTYNNANYGYKPVATGAVSAYTPAEYAKAWYRYISAAATAAADGETKAATATAGLGYKTTANIEMGLKQTINGFSSYTHQATSPVKGEPEGAAATRYVEIRLNHLDMSDLHVKTDKQLRDVVRVWKKLNLPDVTVLLDGNSSREFEMSQKTVKLINDINAATTGKSFKVMPCDVATHRACNTIVITGGGNVQDMTFIEPNGAKVADVALKAGETWAWKAATTEAKTVKVKAAGVAKIINRGTFVNDANAILKTAEPNGTQNFIPFENARNANWNLTAGTVRVQFNVTNYGTVTISKGAQYRQDGNAGATVFTNEATGIPARFTFSGAIPRGDDLVGTVWNRGVFATLGTGGTATINNYGLIEHDDVDAKTYITANQTAGALFTKAFADPANKMGRINLPWLNRNEDNISVSANLNQGFISLTVDDNFTSESLSLATGTIGDKVNYLKVNSASVKEITGVVNQIDYLEVQAPNEVAWNVTGSAYNFVGLMVLSDVNIKLGTTVNVTGATYLGADMYVGGNFTWNKWSGYYGNTGANVATKYITY